ncbi:MAG: alpha-2-macroglobulin [Silanimonas sp.]|jgi:uncharacterized protein YfaS (alpha-2-macroglobulin family)|nr:alpha-2-macroglobulin [Silanimonas sp.]
MSVTDEPTPSSWSNRVFGAWQPPAWLAEAFGWFRADPRRRLGAPVAILALAALAGWWFTRPVPPPPDAIAATVEGPSPTDYRATPITVGALRLRFEESVAPLAAVGADADAGTAAAVEGLTLEPALAGRWAFEDDRTLAFLPAEDWPVGQSYTVSIDPARALAPGKVLVAREWQVDTAPFALEVAGGEFYQDPSDPTIKRAVWTLRASHPLDEERLRTRLAATAEDGAGRSLPAPSTELRVDGDGLRAWVQTSTLAVPENGGRVRLAVAAGAKSRLPGPGVAAELDNTVYLPSLYSVALTSVDAVVADDPDGQPRQALVLGFNDTLRDRDVVAKLGVVLLPERFVPRPGHPADPDDASQRQVPYPWSEGEIDAAVLRAGTPLRPELIAAEREWVDTHALRFQAPPGRRLHVALPKGMKSFGGFLMGEPVSRVVEVPAYPSLLRFVGEGALLALRGERRVTVVGRNVANARLEVGRVVPEQLQMLVAANDGSFQQPSTWRVEEDQLVERFEETLSLPTDDPARASYRGIDLGTYFDARKRGVFLLSLRSMSDDEAALTPRERLDRDAGTATDTRMVVLTDLGVLAKTELDGKRKVFVQSLSAGTPVAGARVSVVGRNGQVVASANTTAEGVATLPSFEPFVRERRPVLLQVTSGDDLSFLPLDDWARRLDTSRFDVGGEINAVDPGALSAVLFSDRGLYRPGETVHLGLVLRAQDWSRTPVGAPLEIDITDPSGQLVARDTLRFGAAGFEGYDFTPPESGPSGTWMAQLFLKGRDGASRTLVGSTSVQVREFQPDTLRVALGLSSPGTGGWVRPAGLKAVVDVQNLFGTAAQDRRVATQMRLTPSVPAFPAWPGYRFHDPATSADGVQPALEDVRTDATGRAEIDLGLDGFERATYRVDLLVRAYEPGSGRGVAATLKALVSDAPYLVGLKAGEGLAYVNRGARAGADLVVLGPDGRPVAIDGLQLVRIERRMVSVLTRGDDGLYRFVSRERRDEKDRRALPAKAAPQAVALETATPGDWTLEVQDREGRVLNRLDWTVVGDANLTRSLERNAELQVTLSKPTYAPGEAIEVSIRAPYAGAGLITIERDQVYAQQWFKADTTSSVQRIVLPEGLEGNAYVSVSLLRDPASDEVHTSPLSWGVVPFAIDRGARQLPLAMTAPAKARPGQPLSIDLDAGGPARVAVFAVDEGILQVAGYRVPDPLDRFFAKRMHQVESAQILDLLLPEFSRLAGGAAPGGDGEGEGARHLNPFKRKGEAPAVWWSGVVDVDGPRRFTFTPPDHFNGELRLVAVAVTPARMALREGTVTVRGDFVLTPTLPTHVAPGDTFDVPVGVANTIEGAKAPATVQLTVQQGPGLALEGPAPKPLTLAPGAEGVVTVRLKAGQALGPQALLLRASSGPHAAQRRVETSVRPVVPSTTTVSVRAVQRATAITSLRALHAERAQRRLAASSTPLVALVGLQAWLGDYRYTCTEQLASKALPALVLRSHPAFGRAAGDGDLSGLFGALRSRQNGDGGFGTWTASAHVDPFVSAYAVLVLVEARERGERVPGDLLDRANAWLAEAAVDRRRNDLPGLRARALAVYLQVRQGEAAGNALSALVEQLERDQPKAWRDDLAGLLVAASYQGLQQPAAATPLARRARELTAAAPAAKGPEEDFYDRAGAQAWRLYLLGKHFPSQARELPAAAVDGLLTPLQESGLNSLNAALAVLALDAVGGTPAAPVRFEQEWPGGKAPFGTVADGVLAGEYRGDATRLMVTPDAGQRLWVAQTERGFDRTPPPAVQDRGLEVQRDYLDAEGRPTTTVAQGDELTVRLRVRGAGWDHVAVLDLLPGGFEVVLSPPAAAEAAAPQDRDGDGEPDAPSEEASEPAAPVLAVAGSTFVPDHAEVREDRVVLYGAMTPDVREFRYRIRATATGSFRVPPAFAEHLYRARVLTRGDAAGTLTVTAPAR